ncbi:tape measure protein [Vreelandella populi]|uniref:EF-hand domain-containing protein n=1 Tax=Vreelandella populi TaxID=2498858 RepID=A0A433L840_9GAMM|nr:tape measure protein [Halomonas populi]RUR43378.1 hypothetical protein ELY37_16810 [Halomonas populi]
MAQNYKTGLIITGDASGGIRAIKATEDELGKLNQGFSRGSRHSKSFGNDAARAGQQLGEVKHGASEATQGLTLVRQAATLAAAAFSIRQLGVYADGWSELNSRVLNVTKDLDVSEQTMGRLAETARGTYSSLNQTAEAYLNNATTLTELGYSTERQLDLSDALNNSLVISATRGQKASSVMDALSKSFADGQLRGNNFNTVIQSGGRIAEALAAGLGVTTIELRKMAADGQLTTARVFEALTSQMEVLRKEAEEMPATIADGWTLIGNSSMELVGRLDKAFGASEGIAGVMINAADAITASTEPLVDNIETIKDVATLTAIVMGGRYAAAFAASAKEVVTHTAATLAQAQADAIATTAARAKAAETLRVAAAEQAAAARALANGHAIAAATGNTTLRTKAITQMAAANQRAIAAEAGHTAAVNANAAAMARGTVAAQGMAAANRAGAGALALMGGPGGAAVVAVGALYYFREELGFVDAAAQNATNALDANSDAIRDGTAAALDATYDNLVNSLEAVSLQAQEAMAQLTELEARQAFYENSHKGMADSVTGAVDQQTEALAGLWARQVELQTAIRKNREAREDATAADRAGARALEDIVVTADAASKSTAKAAKETTTLSSAYESLLDRIQPNRRAARQYAQDVGVLSLALATGRMNTVQYMQAMGQLQESFQAAQRETEKTATASEDASQRIANSFTTWGTVADNTLRSVDDSGRDAWLGLIDGSTSALDTVKRGFQQTLAEIAHMLTTQKLTFHAAGMMGLDTTGMPGGGMNIGSLASVGNTVSGWFGGGAAVASAAPIGYASGFGAQAATGTYTGWAGSAAAGAAQTGGGFMAGAGAAMPWIGAGLLADNVLGLGITDGIVKGIGKLFGGGKTNPHLNIDTRADAGSYGHESVRSGAFGAVGFGQGTRRSNDLFGGIPEEREFLAALAASDDLLASLARSPEELNAMASAVQGVRLSASDVDGVMAQLSNRTVAAVSAIDGEFGAFVGSLGGDVDTIIARTQSAMGALTLLGDASHNLNLQFDASAAGALRAADNIAQYAGGIDQLASLQDSYYQSYFSEAERAANLQREVTQAMTEMGYAMPATRDGYRQLVEQQNRFTEAGQRNYVQLLELAGPFDQLQTMLGNAGDGVGAFADQLAALNDQISTLEADVRAAYRAFDNQSFKQQVTLLEMAGDSQAALALQRERELLSIDPLLHETQRVIWSIEDEAQAKQNATQAAQRYVSELSRVRDQLSSTFGNIAQWVDQRNATSGAPGMNLAEAGDQFARQLILAQSGDRSALQSITQYADQYLTAGEAMYASGGAFQRIQQDVLDALQDLPDQLSAEQFLADEIRDALQSVVISAMPTDERLATQLSRELVRLDTNQLTHAQVRAALSPIASDAEISRLIREVDANGDGIITQQELANLRLGGLASGIGSTLAPMFDAIDLDASGLINWDEFYSVFAGMASDDELRRIFNKLDADGSGTISRLEALGRSSEGTEDNTESLEKQAHNQLRELNGLVGEMTRTTNQFVSLNSTMLSLRDSINALGVAQEEIARIERERAGAELAAQAQILRDRQQGQRGSHNALQSELNAISNQNTAGLQNNLNAYKKELSSGPTKTRIITEADQLSAKGWSSRDIQEALGGPGRTVGRETVTDTARVNQLNQLIKQTEAQIAQQQHQNAQRASELQRQLNSSHSAISAFDAELNQLRNDYRAATGKAAPFANGGVFTNRIVSSPTYFDMGLMGEAGDEAIVPLSRGAGGRLGIDATGLMKLPDGPLELPMPNVPMPQFPALDNRDVVQVLQDLRSENKQLRTDINRLLGDVKTNTGNTANAVASSASRAEQQRRDQLEEQRAATSAARVRSRTA